MPKPNPKNAQYTTIIKVQEFMLNLAVEFANGDRVIVPKSAIVPKNYKVFWDDAVQIIYDGVAIALSATPKRLEITWETIRKITDKKYARRTARLAVDHALYVGKKVRELRLRRGFTQEEVAERTGIEVADIVRFENGHIGSSASTLLRILGAMGYGAGDLASSRPE